MGMGTIKLTREELYQQVWKEPITRLAWRYGFSDVWLARICRRNNIPRPPRGYWARVESGQRPPRKPLPRSSDARVIEIMTHDPERKKGFPLSNEARASRRLLRSIMVFPADPLNRHPFVCSSACILDSVEPDGTGIVPRQRGCLDVQVSEEAISRALNIMDSFIRIITAMGFELSLSGGMTLVSKEGVSLAVSIHEEMGRRRRLKAADHKLEGYYQFGYKMYEDRAYPSGRLVFSVGGIGSEGRHSRIWRDTNTMALEDHLKNILSSLVRITAARIAQAAGEGDPELEA